MAVFDALRNALLAGLGVQEKVKEFIEDLIKKGELSESQGAKLVKEWADTANKTSEQLNKNVSEIFAATMEKMNLPTKGDLDKLNDKIQSLASRLEKLEGTKEG